MNRPFNRAQRVGGQMQRVLAELIQKGINDPRLAQATVTGVTLSRDLRIAKIYFAAHRGEVDRQSVLAGFESAKGFIKRELARELGLRYMPELKFFYDGSFDYSAHINRILKTLHSDDEADHSTSDD